MLSYGASGGGAGGYEPALQMFGGDGATLNTVMVKNQSASYIIRNIPDRLAGIAGSVNTSVTYENIVMETGVSQYANRVNGGKGTRQLAAGNYSATSGADGNGYGAGGRGGSNGAGTSNYGGAGGNAGSFIQGTYKLDSIAGIEVTVGNGGLAVNNANNYAGHGAPGIVIVFW